MFNWNVHLRNNPVHADWQARMKPTIFLACMLAAASSTGPCMHAALKLSAGLVWLYGTSGRQLGGVWHAGG